MLLTFFIFEKIIFSTTVQSKIFSMFYSEIDISRLVGVLMHTTAWYGGMQGLFFLLPLYYTQ